MKELFIVLLIIFLSACSSHAPDIASLSSLSQAQVLNLLQEQHAEWKGTPYQYGGTSRSGVDCSGFTFRTYKDKLGLLLPRTTLKQVKLGSSVSRSALRTGDLVFFKISKRLKHVGIYMEKNQFIHASSSKGVMISSLKNPYWSSRYWTARRL